MGNKFRAANVFIPVLCLFLWLCFQGCTQNHQEGPAADSHGAQTLKTSSGIEMVIISGGWFDMGSDKNSPDESPAHKVWVDTFMIDRYEVTQAQFQKLELSNPSRFEGDNLPAEQQTWVDAARFCNERSYREGLELCYDEETWECNFDADGYRLPTEAEWEYACRAGTDQDYFFGGDSRKLKNYAFYKGNSSQATHPVGTRKPNPWGLFDMSGNVAEWCNDFFSDDYYERSPERNPRGPEAGRMRVIRGGAWNSSADSCRSTYRSGSASVDDDCVLSDAIGFRCVRKAKVKIERRPADSTAPIVQCGLDPISREKRILSI